MGPRGASGPAPGPGAGVAYSLLEEQPPAADRKPQGGRWLLWLPVLVAATVLYALNINNEMHYHGPTHGHLVPTEEVQSLHRTSNSFLVDSAGCRLPALDPLDRMVREYIFQPQPLDCTRGRGRALVASNLTALFVVEDALPDYNVTSVDDLSCCYRPFWRKPNAGDDGIVEAPNCTDFWREAAVAEAFVRVECWVDGALVYEDLHAFVPLLPEVEGRCAAAAAREAAAEGPNVLLLGIDAVSRLNFHRQMPRTAQLLVEMGVIEMLGYNKVGDNTFPNLVPALTGLRVEELRNVCWPEDRAPFDDCPFLWNDFRDAGYRTAFGEDAPWMGIFNYVKHGFNKQPTDYYLRPFASAIENRIGHAKEMNAKLCVGSRMTVEVLLQYVSKFARTFASERYMALFWGASLSHDFLNYPRLGDALYASVLRELRASGALQRTVLVLLSDHGIRWGGIRNTYQGRMEERLPFLFFVFPDWFRERYAAAVANVGRNARRLTTPFDLYETLRDLLRPAQRLTQDAVRARSQALSATPSPAADRPPRAVSLFLEVPRDRTCAEAAIDPHWCTCQQSQPVNRTSPIVKRTANFLMDHINKIVSSFRQCAQLLLAEIKDVQLEVPQERIRKEVKDTSVYDYVLVVRTEPGNAIFEATVRHIPKTNNLTIAGFVSRLNVYGSQSACVSNFHLKLYCYCTS
ncbi:Uncharacterized protein GBIM_20653 [Gryllus bimaculatus]|nr:Uncharacterized protein GBIM_20653 [Gryllus bimaculatus]